MRTVRSHKLISIVFAIMIMISGICLDEVQASSYSSCRQELYLQSGDNIVIQDEPVCRTVRLSQRDVISSIQQMRSMNRGIGSRIEYEMGLCYLDIDILPQKILAVAVNDTCSSSDQLYTTAIIDFIHSQDGNKLDISSIA